ncbi:MAG: UMP kinase [Planctomycetes bacterium]|nr:UMP kinase [Planctomycetota bacterium]MCP4771730.1 UMP kinase [Planctomycetota bacterium]MCP4859615.1 UMP kinase [Planctomycetota bacterium]
MTESKSPFQRILLKISGEGFAREGETGLDTELVKGLAEQLRSLTTDGIQVACVIGGGNILRGKQSGSLGIARATADYMGMLATVINGLALADALESNGVPTRVMSAIDVHKVCEPFIRRRALRHLEKGRVVVLVGGLGSPYFTTDTAAAQRAIELDCDALLKATMVDGVYDKDPHVHKDAVHLPELSFDQVIQRQLRVMDQTAFTLCREHDLPLLVFDMNAEDGLSHAGRGHNIGTIIRN